MVLLKCEGYSAKQIAGIVNSNMAGTYKWLNGYDTAGIAGLRTPPEQGRKPILAEAHISIVRAAVEQQRQRLLQVRQIVEENTGRKMSRETLTRSLKVITAVTSG